MRRKKVNKKHKKIWDLALPYLKKGVRKDFVLHTKNVVKAMETILKEVRADKDIMIPAAILHDVGWAKVPLRMQKSWMKKELKIKGEELHLKYAPPIIKKILKEVDYKEQAIKQIIDIILAHKFSKPRDINKQMLIDADNLSDAFKDQFYSDIKKYECTPEVNYAWRMKNNKFYTKAAQGIFEKEMKNRKNEISNA